MNSAAGRVIVVGGGVLGTMHAVAARRRGFDVVQLEREPDARSARVRSFGLIWVSGRAELTRAGAPHILDSVAGFPALLGL